jgi:hypothetical protein
MAEDPLAGPPRVEVSAEWIRTNLAKQKAYEQSRRMWTSGFTPSQPRAQAAGRSRANRRIEDTRQTKMDLWWLAKFLIPLRISCR